MISYRHEEYDYDDKYDYLTKELVYIAIEHMWQIPKQYRDEIACKIHSLGGVNASLDTYGWWTVASNAQGEPVIVCSECSKPKGDGDKYCSYCGSQNGGQTE